MENFFKKILDFIKKILKLKDNQVKDNIKSGDSSSQSSSVSSSVSPSPSSKSPSSISEPDERAVEAIGKMRRDISDLKTETSRIKKEIEKTQFKSIEIIGIISTIIALVLAFISQATTEGRPLQDSFIILVTIAASFIIFATLIHHFFNEESKRGFWYYCLFFFIPSMVIVLVSCFIFREYIRNLYNIVF